jgi:hypothetical protein
MPLTQLDIFSDEFFLIDFDETFFDPIVRRRAVQSTTTAS